MALPKLHWYSLCIFILVGAVLGSSASAQEEIENEDLDEVWFHPEELELVMEGTTEVVTWMTNTTRSIKRVWAVMEKWREAEVSGFSEPFIGVPEIETNATDLDLSNVTHYGFVNVTAKFVGYNTLLVTLYDHMNKTVAEGKQSMTVKLKTDYITSIFTYLSAALTAFTYFLMGMTINLKVVKGIAKRPIGPLVGIFCQYVMMPLISFGVGILIFPGDNFEDRLLRLGMFLSGSCPGGGASNMWTHLLGGSLDLSIMMTGVSTFVAFGSIPLWVLSLGPVIINDANFVIPYVDITITVITLIIPCGIGILFQARFPQHKLVKICSMMMSPTCAINLLITFTFGVYAYLYVFTLFTWRMLLAGFLLPTLGYSAGMLFALMFRMETPRIIAIGVETGVQNYTIALIILMLTLSSPAGEIATAMPAAFMLFTPVPLLMLFVGRRGYLWMQGRSPHDHTSTDLKDVPTKTSVSKGAVQQHNSLEKKGGIDNLAADLSDKV